MERNLSEPAKIWRDELAVNRACQISFDCVWKTSGGKPDFCGTNDLHGGELSTVVSFWSDVIVRLENLQIGTR